MINSGDSVNFLSPEKVSLIAITTATATANINSNNMPMIANPVGKIISYLIGFGSLSLFGSAMLYTVTPARKKQNADLSSDDSTINTLPEDENIPVETESESQFDADYYINAIINYSITNIYEIVDELFINHRQIRELHDNDSTQIIKKRINLKEAYEKESKNPQMRKLFERIRRRIFNYPEIMALSGEKNILQKY